MIITEKKYWANGHRIMGGWFHTLAFNILNLGFMFCWGKRPSNKKISLSIKFYKLI